MVSQDWITQFGSEGVDYVSSIAVNSFEKLYFGGATSSNFGTLNIGAQDIVFGMLDASNGDLITSRADGSDIGGKYTIRMGTHTIITIITMTVIDGLGYIQMGTEVIDYLSVLTIDSKDNVIIGGHTGGDFIQINAGEPPSTDVWYAKYTWDLKQLFIDQYGTDGYDYISDMTYYKSNHELMTDNAIMGGYSSGRFGPVHVGNLDFWVLNYTFMTFQGGYQCSVRSVTEWERVGPPHLYQYVLEHPNYFSGYMDPKVENDGIQYSNWSGMQWPPVHEKTAPLYIREDIMDYAAKKPQPTI